MTEAVIHGDTLNQERNYITALGCLLPLLVSFPDNHWLNFQIGRAYSGIGDRENAVKHFFAAARSSYPYRVGAMYEVVKHDFSMANFDRIRLLDEALLLPGDIAGKDEASHQKRFYYAEIKFLKALFFLNQGSYDRCEGLLAESYRFLPAVNENVFRFPWLLSRLGAAADFRGFPHIEYLRQVLLRVDMNSNVNYHHTLNAVGPNAQVLEIGAMDGVRFDPLHQHLISKDWHAILVEPLSDMYALLRQNYSGYDRIRCVNVAISDTTGPLVLFRVKPESVTTHGHGEWVLGISSAFKGQTLTYLGDIVTEEEVTGLSFADFVKKFETDKIDVLQIDTEGYELNILRQIDLAKWKIKVINVEIINLQPPDRLKVFRMLKCAGYSYNYEGMDVTAVLVSDPAINAPA